jgi:L-2-hydroxycarboxylate dehydrogenase (NAD+)
MNHSTTEELFRGQILVPVSEAREVASRILIGCGAPEDHAAVQVDLLIEAELRGRASHGLLRLRRIVERIRSGLADPAAIGKHEWRGSAFLDVDGARGLGPVIALRAIAELRARARETGVAVAAVRNNNHLGMLAWYVERVASGGQVAIALTTSEALVHPWGGRKAMIGTNPIAIGVPAKPHPFVLDMATGIVSMGQIHDYAHRHEAIPEHWALDGDGKPTTDPDAAKQGAIAPFGREKGYALGLAFEILVATLTGAAMGTDVRGTLDSSSVCNKGDVFVVLEPKTGMAEPVTAYLDAIRACSPIDQAGAETGSETGAVMAPGDRARACRERRLAEGIPIASEVWRGLKEMVSE